MDNNRWKKNDSYTFSWINQQTTDFKWLNKSYWQSIITWVEDITHTHTHAWQMVKHVVKQMCLSSPMSVQDWYKDQWSENGMTYRSCHRKLMIGPICKTEGDRVATQGQFAGLSHLPDLVGFCQTCPWNDFLSEVLSCKEHSVLFISKPGWTSLDWKWSN